MQMENLAPRPWSFAWDDAAGPDGMTGAFEIRDAQGNLVTTIQPGDFYKRPDPVAAAAQVAELVVMSVNAAPSAPITIEAVATFQSNRSQAVRLPKDVAFPEGVREVAILRDGARRVIVPANAVWDDFFSAPGVDLPDRDQPQIQARESL